MRLPTLLLLAAISASANAALPALNSAAYCKKIAASAPTITTLEASCLKAEEKSLANLKAIAAIPEAVQTYCTRSAEANGGSYKMMDICVKERMRAVANNG